MFGASTVQDTNVQQIFSALHLTVIYIKHLACNITDFSVFFFKETFFHDHFI